MHLFQFHRLLGRKGIKSTKCPFNTLKHLLWALRTSSKCLFLARVGVVSLNCRVQLAALASEDVLESWCAKKGSKGLLVLLPRVHMLRAVSVRSWALVLLPAWGYSSIVCACSRRCDAIPDPQLAFPLAPSSDHWVKIALWAGKMTQKGKALPWDA